MQVAAMAPVAVDKDGIPQNVIDHEFEIGREKAREEGKPENMLDKIAQGRLNKFFQESTLLNQVFEQDGKMSVKEYLKSVNCYRFLTFHVERLIQETNLWNIETGLVIGLFFYPLTPTICSKNTPTFF